MMALLVVVRYRLNAIYRHWQRPGYMDWLMFPLQAADMCNESGQKVGRKGRNEQVAGGE